MRIEIRLYKQHDLDLASLAYAGYSVAGMMRDALYALVTRQPFKIQVVNVKLPDISDLNKVHFTLTFSKNDSRDTAVINMLNSVRPSFRNAFSKMILRNALLYQNFWAYLLEDYGSLFLSTASYPKIVDNETEYVHSINEYKIKHKAVKEKTTITVQSSKIKSVVPQETTPLQEKKPPIKEETYQNNINVEQYNSSSAIQSHTPLTPTTTPLISNKGIQINGIEVTSEQLSLIQQILSDQTGQLNQVQNNQPAAPTISTPDIPKKTEESDKTEVTPDTIDTSMPQTAPPSLANDDDLFNLFNNI